MRLNESMYIKTAAGWDKQVDDGLQQEHRRVTTTTLQSGIKATRTNKTQVEYIKASVFDLLLHRGGQNPSVLDEDESPGLGQTTIVPPTSGLPVLSLVKPLKTCSAVKTKPFCIICWMCWTVRDGILYNCSHAVASFLLVCPRGKESGRREWNVSQIKHEEKSWNLTKQNEDKMKNQVNNVAVASIITSLISHRDGF